jgi:diaminohydroxyphosphoribosylaminopyrimidine deaminase / 5-amino-6-(5-phosphoribosylamino)uracil reductase
MTTKLSTEVEFMEEHNKFMKIAINMAKSGIGKTFPKPSVGAIIVKDGLIVAKAVTSNTGIHAEPLAIEQAGENAKGADMYVTLEPCNHQGTTPPCVDAVIAGGIKRVFVANRDINPVAAGGIERLKQAGIEVFEDICSKEALVINKTFFNIITKKRPYITVKVGTSLDGKIALSNGMSKYITSEISRNYAQVLRSKSDGILVGVNTIIYDNPVLSCRLPGLEKKLTKIILDTNHRTPESSNIIKNAKNDPVIIFSSRSGKSSGAEIIKTPTNKNNNFVDLHYVVSTLAKRGFERLLVEGGGKIISNFLAEDLVDELHMIYSSKILGENAVSFASKLYLSEIPEEKFRLVEERRLGSDILLIFKNKNLD